MMIEPLMQINIDNKQFIEISNFAAPGIRKYSYFINMNGEIFSKISNRYMSFTINAQGYKVVNLHLENGSQNIFLLHRLLMITFKFIYNYEYMQVNHINGIKIDNRLENLEWVTLQENNLHAKITGLICTGEDCSWSTLSDNQVREICQRIQDKDYTTLTDLAQEYNCSPGTIGRIARGEDWKQISKDYDMNYSIRQKFTENEIRFICRTFEQNKEKSFQYLYYLIIFCLNLPDDKLIRRRIYKLYTKDPRNYSYITSQYDY